LVPLACLYLYFRVDFLGEVGGGTPVVALSSVSPPAARQVTATALAVLARARRVRITGPARPSATCVLKLTPKVSRALSLPELLFSCFSTSTTLFQFLSSFHLGRIAIATPSFSLNLGPASLAFLVSIHQPVLADVTMPSDEPEKGDKGTFPLSATTAHEFRDMELLSTS
jgi:hypothetical protein